MLEDAWRDIRYGARALRRSPGFTAVAALTLAIGIGAPTTVFSVVNGVLIKPLPYLDAESLVGVWHVAPGIAGGRDTWMSSSQFFTYRGAKSSASCKTFMAMGYTRRHQ